MQFAYPAAVTRETNGSYSVTFKDVPEAHATGRTEAVARRRAVDALVTALSFYVDDNQPVPRPGPARGKILVPVPAPIAAKLALNEAMRTNRLSNQALARALDCDEKAVRRLRALLHASRMPELERALAAVGLRLVVEVRKAA